MKNRIKVMKLICERCGHEWVPRGNIIKTCPMCRSPYWDTPKQEKQTQSQGEKK